MKRFTIGAAALLLILTACSGNHSLPAASGGASATMPESSFGVRLNGIAPDGVLPDGCNNPSTLRVCVKPGGSGKLKLTLTCKVSSEKVNCGKVTWSAKTSNKGLTVKWKPDPGNPSTETITASKSIKVGHYTQTIVAKCTGIPKCVEKGKGQIWVIK